MVAQPTLVYDEAYFTGGADQYGVYGYTDYASPLTYLSERPAQMVDQYISRLAVTGKTVLVAGCAMGLTVQELRARGVAAWGLDISAYAISQAPADVRPYLVVGDARIKQSWDAARSLAGFRGNTKFALTLTEDLLPCLSDADAVTMSTLARGVTSGTGNVAHLFEDNQSEQFAHWYNTHTPAEWKTLLGPDRIISRFSWAWV